MTEQTERGSAKGWGVQTSMVDVSVASAVPILPFCILWPSPCLEAIGFLQGLLPAHSAVVVDETLTCFPLTVDLLSVEFPASLKFGDGGLMRRANGYDVANYCYSVQMAFLFYLHLKN